MKDAMDEGTMKMNAAGRLAAAKADPALAWLDQVMAAMTSSEWYLVGGSVRDALIGRDGRKDFDLVVRNVGLDDLERELGRRGRVDLVGKTFGVLKFWASGADAPAVDI